MSIFSERLTELRGSKSQKEVSTAIGVINQTYGRYENGERLPNIDILKAIAGYYNVSADYLLGLSDVKSRNTDIQTACTVTGLSEKVINNILKFHDKQPLELFLESPMLNYLLENLTKYAKAVKNSESSIYSKYEEANDTITDEIINAEKILTQKYNSIVLVNDFEKQQYYKAQVTWAIESMFNDLDIE